MQVDTRSLDDEERSNLGSESSADSSFSLGDPSNKASKATKTISLPVSSMVTPTNTTTPFFMSVPSCFRDASSPSATTTNVQANVVRSTMVTPTYGFRQGSTPQGGEVTPLDSRGETAKDCELASNSSHSAAEFSRERALENFHRTYSLIREHINKMKAGAKELPADGNRLVAALRSVMTAADDIDNFGDDETTTIDWRDDDNTVTATSAFFHSQTTLETSSNQLVEAILAKGRAAQSDAELRWLYRNSTILSLMNSEDLDHIVPSSLRREYSDGETILDSDVPVTHIFSVVWGAVDVFAEVSSNVDQGERSFRVGRITQTRAQSPRKPNKSISSIPELIIQESLEATKEKSEYTHIATLSPGQIFGLENCVFGEKSEYVYRAANCDSKTVVSLIPFNAILTTLARNPRFAQGVGSAIASNVDVFGPVRQFCRYVFSPASAQNEYLPLWSIVESYTRIENVIHTKLFSKELDTGAWGYALNRLPENITSTFCFDLVHALPPFVASRMRTEAHAADVRKAQGAERGRTAITYIRTKERRRCTWHLGMEGKTLVLLRDGFTDLLDFLTMLCVHIIESNKLRGRIQGMVHPPAIDILDGYLRAREEEVAKGVVVSAEDERKRIQETLSRMPLTVEEQEGLLRNWNQNTLLRIYEVMMHREEFNVRVDPSISRKFQTNPFHEWALNLRGCVLEKLGLSRSSPLPKDLYVDVVSSNTHCIKNLLSSFNRKYRSQILQYAVRKEGKKLGRPTEWQNINDMIYVAVNGFLQNERPDLKEEYNKSLEDSGIMVLQDTAMTGLQVDVIPVHCLDFNSIDDTVKKSLQNYYEQNQQPERPEKSAGGAEKFVPSWQQVCRPIYGTDGKFTGFECGDASSPTTETSAGASSAPPQENNSPAEHPPRQAEDGSRLARHFIINMDFAFGAQAEGICRAVFGAFGRSIRSVSVMGKAGGLCGKRGDIQLASHVLLSKSSLILEDNQDELRNCRNQDLTAERLKELAGPRIDVHHGNVLTVTGTMLQNAQLLRFYKHVWRCVGTEMEGSYFARVIEDFYRQGIAHPQLVTRFAYYTSDLPLAHSEAEEEAQRAYPSSLSLKGAATLSAPMTPQEGVPPLYAIARGILENVLLS